MRQPPHGFSLDRLARVLDVHWRIIVRACEYLPVGFGAHHWRVRDARGAGYFLALHDLGADADFGFDSLARAPQTA